MRNDTASTQGFVCPRSAVIVHAADAVASVLRRALAEQRFTRVVECRGADLVPTLERAGFVDLVLVDHQADGVGALDLIAYVRHRLPLTPVLLVGPGGAGLLVEAAVAQGASCLAAPVELAAAAAAIRAALATGTGEGGAEGGVLLRSGWPRSGPAAARLWAVVLAGGEGRRLRPLVRHVHGDDRPKQYATLVGSRSLLDSTLDRTALLVPGERTAIVSVRRHRRYLRQALAERAATVLAQPADRGTAAGILLPVQWILQRDPGATVAIFPSDHFVAEDRRFMAHVADAAAFVDGHPERIVLVGVEATGPETEYGWIEAAEPLARIGPTSFSAVARFVEKPPPAQARACLEAGALWNTFVVIGRAAALADATRQLLPLLADELQAAVPLLGTGPGLAALRRAYARLRPASFSSEVLERCGPALAVSRLTGATWCDWGSPRRVVRTLLQLGARPPWLATFVATRPA